jgi:hypothetical protein
LKGSPDGYFLLAYFREEVCELGSKEDCMRGESEVDVAWRHEIFPAVSFDVSSQNLAALRRRFF